MKPVVSALDFARLFHLEREGDLIPPGEVAKKLRELADLVERGVEWWEYPKLALMAAYSMHRTGSRQIATNTLILEFETFHDPESDPRVVGTGSEEEKQLRLKEYKEAMARWKRREKAEEREKRLRVAMRGVYDHLQRTLGPSDELQAFEAALKETE